jgi:hypothetical protein
MASKEVDLVGKVGAHTILPLLGNLHACINASIPLDSEYSKVLEDKELVDVHEWFSSFVCCL